MSRIWKSWMLVGVLFASGLDGRGQVGRTEVGRQEGAAPLVVNAAPPANQPSSIPLYPEGAPSIEGAVAEETWGTIYGQVLVRNVTKPTIAPYLPDPAKATGAGVVVAPGGGFVSLAMDIEGWQVAQWLAEHGVAAFLLKYRLTPSPVDPVALRKFESDRDAARSASNESRQPFAPAIEDGIAAVRLVRSRAGSFGVDPDRVGMIGFSAGAWNALGVALANKADARPAFIGLIYGPTQAVEPPPAAPALFAAVAANDPLFTGENKVVSAWRTAGYPAEFHIYQTGGHGFGMMKNGTTTELWPDEFLAWLRMNKFLKRE